MQAPHRSLTDTIPREGDTPLIYAARQNRAADVVALLADGADVNEAKPGGATALYIAATATSTRRRRCSTRTSASEALGAERERDDRTRERGVTGGQAGRTETEGGCVCERIKATNFVA